MALYKVLQDSFINGAFVVAGSVVDYDPPEGTEIADNLELAAVDGRKRGAAKPADAE